MTALFITALVFAAMISFLTSGQQQAQWSYSDLVRHVQAGDVKEVTISGGSATATDKKGAKYDVSLPDQTATLASDLTAAGVNVHYQNSGGLGSTLTALLPNLLFFALIGGLLWWLYRGLSRGQQNQAMLFGRSTARLATPQPDPALLRPGRFDRRVVLDRPDVRGRRAILDVHARNKPLAANVDLDTLARQTPGFCGAELANVVNEAAILAARAGNDTISTADLEEAVARAIAGPERKTMRISDEEKRIVAFHEAGHALVMAALPRCDRVHRISIISRGSALGWTLSLPGDDQHLVDEEALREQLAGIMGGRAAEELVFHRATSGDENDIQKATRLARRMVTQWGMSERLGTVAMGENQELVFLGRDLGEQRNYSEKMASLIDDEVRRIVEDARSTASRVLSDRRQALGSLAERLIAEETIDGNELEQLLAAGDAPARPVSVVS